MGDKNKEIGGNRVTLTESPRGLEQRSKNPINQKGEGTGIKTRFDLGNARRREIHSSKGAMNCSPTKGGISFFNVNFDNHPRGGH